MVDFRTVENTLRELCERFDVREIAFDPHLARNMLNNLLEDGFPAIEMRQGPLTMGPALVSRTDGACVPASIDLHVTFIRPVKPGRVIGKGRIVSQGKTIAFLEGELFDEEGNLLARSTSSARIVTVK